MKEKMSQETTNKIQEGWTLREVGGIISRAANPIPIFLYPRQATDDVSGRSNLECCEPSDLV